MSKMLALLALTSHLIAGFAPNETYTVYVDDEPQLEVQVSQSGTINFDLQTGGEVRIGLRTVPNDPEPDPTPAPVPARFGVVAAPSPTSGPLNVLISVPESGASHTHVELFDASGRVVGDLSFDLTTPGTHRVAWDARRLESGLYFVRATRGGEERVTRFVVVR